MHEMKIGKRETFNLSFEKQKFKRVACVLEMIGNESETHSASTYLTLDWSVINVLV